MGPLVFAGIYNRRKYYLFGRADTAGGLAGQDILGQKGLGRFGSAKE
jgi:hypothetical protein